jgi:hypothetical protein
MIESRAHDRIEKPESISKRSWTVQQRMKVPGLEAVVNAARSLGGNGRGKGGVGGYMAAMASEESKRFAPLLEMALQLKNSGWRGEEAFESYEQFVKRIEEMRLDEIVMQYLISVDELRPLDDGPPSSATDFADAIIAAAGKHGANGRGKDGVEGYIRMLARIGCRTLDRWVIRAMVAQVKGRSPKSRKEVEARLQERGVDLEAMFGAAFLIKHGRWPPESSFAKGLEAYAGT